MTRLHRHPAASLLSRCRLGTMAAARIVREIVPDAGRAPLGLMSSEELADEIADGWRALSGRSIHVSEDEVLVVERDRKGRVKTFEIEGVRA